MTRNQINDINLGIPNEITVVNEIKNKKIYILIFSIIFLILRCF